MIIKIETESQRESLEIERSETLKSIQMWINLHPEDYEYIHVLMDKLCKINSEIETIINLEAIYP